MTKKELEKLADEGNLNSGLDVSKLEPTEKDWIAGIFSGIKYQVVEETMDWRDSFPIGETQKYNTFDDFACTHHTACDNIEAQIKRMIKYGYKDPETGIEYEIDTLKIKDWFDNNGEFNLSDRFNAYTGGNTPGKGNSLTAGPEALRTKGCCPESYWPALMNYSESEFYRKPNQKAYDKAKELLNYFDFPYEQLQRKYNSSLGKKLGTGIVDINDIMYHLKQAPINIATAICPGWFSSNPIGSCNSMPSHATLLGFCNPNILKTILDHYDPYIRNLDWSYVIFYAVKQVVIPKQSILKKKVMSTSKVLKDKNSNALYIALELTNEAACYANLRAFGISFEPKKDENGQDIPNTVNWPSVGIKGEVEFK